MDQNTKIGLVLSGGGTKGAYQAGVYKACLLYTSRRQRLPVRKKAIHRDR